MEHKHTSSIITKLDDAQGIVEHVVAVMGNTDMGGDVIHPGAFTKTLSERGGKVRVLDLHRTDSIMRAIGKPVALREVSAAELPPQVKASYPAANGALLATTQFLMSTPEGKGAFERLKAGLIDEWSFGYDAISPDFSKGTDGATVRNLREVRLWEYSPVLWGMNPATSTLGAKAADEATPTEGKPYLAVHEGDMWRVYKLDAEGKPTGDPLGEHSTEDEANAQVEALYANEPDAEGKATWLAAEINDLPDSSFLYIDKDAATGKDDAGLTVPRSARYFPYRDADGVVDLPHLRNALARIPQSNLSAEIQARLTGMAQAILDKETATEGKDAIFVNAIIALSDAHKARKAGRVLAGRNADKIRAALDALTQVLIDAGVDLEGTTPANEDEAVVSKGAGPASPPTHDRARLLRLVEFEIEVQKNMGG
jgi:phage head maturation protease